MRDISRYIALYKQGRLPVDGLLSGTISLDDINAGFDRLYDGNVAPLEPICKVLPIAPPSHVRVV